MSDPLAPKRRKRDILLAPFRHSSRSRSPIPQSQPAATQSTPLTATSVPVRPAVTPSSSATPTSVPIQPAVTQSTPVPAAQTVVTQPSSVAVAGAPVQPATIPSSPATSLHNIPTGQATGGASSTTDASFLEDVRKRLTEEQRRTLDDSNGQGSGNIKSAFESALQAAEDKKELCISMRWTLKIGSRTFSPRDKAEKVVELLDKFKRIGDIASGADPVHFGLPWAGVSFLLQVAVNEKQQMDAVLSGVATALSMQRTLDVYLDFCNTLAPGSATSNLTMALVETHAVVLGFLANCIELLTKGLIPRFWAALIDDGELQKFASTCIAAEERLDRAANNCGRSLDAYSGKLAEECKDSLHLVVGDLEAIKNQTARIELSISLRNLPCASTAAFDSMDEERMPRCLEKTRVELLSDIDSWVQDPGGAQFFWLQGIAGTGKSTIARTVASSFHDHQILGASFFFKRGHAQRGNTDLFFATIAIQLAQKIPGMDGAMARLLGKEAGVYSKGMHAQFRDLVWNPLRASGLSPQASDLEIIIVIDALDECDSGGDRKDDTAQLLEYLLQLKDIPGLRLRVIVTSRLEPPVKIGFAALGSGAHDDVALHELPLNHIERDIQAFIKAQFDELRCTLSKLHSYQVLADGWPGDKIIQDLTDLSVPLFIFASTICRFIGNRNFAPEDRLQKVLDFKPVQLESTYLLVLQNMVSDSGLDTEETSKDDAMDNFRKIVGVIIFSTEAPSIATLAVLLGLSSHQVMGTLSNLHSVLDVTSDLERPVRPFHLSFIEFLARPRSAHNFQIDERATHHLLAERCLAIMMQQSGGLQQDICQVRKPGMRRQSIKRRSMSFTKPPDVIQPHVIESHVPPALSYACRYWVHHLVAAKVVVDDQHVTLTFLRRWFLYWFEAMSWLGKASEVPRTLRRLQTLTETDRSPRTAELLVDAYQFARHNQYIADLAPLQLYSSALVFAPDISTIKTNSKSFMPSWLLNPPEIGGSWRTDVLKLQGHSGDIMAMAFSPDDKLIGTCSTDTTTRVWDTTDATCLLTIFHKPSYYSLAVAFSSDSSKVAVAHTNYPQVVVTVHDVKTRTLLRTIQCSDTLRHEITLAVAFENGNNKVIIAVIANPEQVQVWRADDSNILIQTCTAHFPKRQNPDPIYVCISQDASLLCCSGFLDESEPDQSSFGVLDPQTGAVICSHGRIETESIMNCSGTYLVRQMAWGGRKSSTLCLRRFDVEYPGESTDLLVLECDDYWRSFSLANAGDRVAFSSWAIDTVHIETIHPGKKVGKRFEAGHSRLVVVSPNLKGDLVADWHDGCLTVLDTQGLVTREFTPHVDDGDSFETARSLAISPDCQYIASVHGKRVTVWHIETGKRSHFSEPRDREELAFSQDNRLIASKDYGTLDAWDTRLGQWLSSMDVFLFERPEFSEDGRDLFVGRSRIHIPTATLTTQELEYPSLFGKEVGLNDDSREWVTFDHEDLFWIPDEYRASSDARGGTVALGQDDGSVMILTFDLSVL